MICKSSLLQLVTTAGGVSRGGVRGATSSSAVSAAPVRVILTRSHRIPHIAYTPCCVQWFSLTDLKLYRIVVYFLRNNFLNVFISIEYLL